MAQKLKTSVQRGKYYKFYNKLVQESMNFSKSNLEPGHFIRTKYKSDSRTSPKESIYLVLQQNFQKKVHVIDLDYVKPSFFDKIVKTLTLKGEPTLTKIKERDMIVLEFKQDKVPLYEAVTRVDKTVKEGYRTLQLSKIKNIQLIKLNLDIATDVTQLNKEEATEEEIKEGSKESKEDFEISDNDQRVLYSLTDRLIDSITGDNNTKPLDPGEFKNIE